MGFEIKNILKNNYYHIFKYYFSLEKEIILIIVCINVIYIINCIVEY